MQIQSILQTVDTKSLVIQVPASFVNYQVEILVITLDESAPNLPQRRHLPPQQLAGRVTEKGDVISSVSAEDWGIH